MRKMTTPGLTTDGISKDTIGDLQKSMRSIFGDLRLDALVSAEETGTFTFTKKKSRNFLYENLSAGEKAAFDLLLDVVVNKAAFDDSLYCVDEPEAHLSTKLQGKLLKELYRLAPDNSQLWLATHSIGMVRTAQEIRAKHPEHVVFLDMGFRSNGEPRNYDKPQTIEPTDPDHDFWSRHYAVALDDMAELLAPDCIVLCEGSTQDDDPALDESCYNKIFAQEFPRALFVSVGSATKVEKRMSGEDIVRLILDGTGVKARLDGRVLSIPLLVVLGVRRDGQKVLLAAKNMGGETEAAWRHVLEDLLGRGLKAPELLIVDGGKGLEAALASLWSDIPVQRCTVHKERNLLAHAPKALHDEVKADYTDMMYAENAEQVCKRRKAFLAKWRLRCRGVADSLEEAGERLFTFLRYPPQQWKSLRTTNAIERLHGEFKRRVKTQCALPNAETAAMLFWALMASGQITMRRVGGWQTLDQAPVKKPIDLAA